jgi:hypothetical protein
MTKVRSAMLVLSGLGLIIGFQNCGGALNGVGDAQGAISSSEKASLVGRYEVEDFIATSSCPDVDSGDALCASVYKEDSAQTGQVVEFLSDGTLVVEGACNTYYSEYQISGNALAMLSIGDLSGTNVVCDGPAQKEESLLLHRLGAAVRLAKDGPTEISIYTDQSSALRLKAL